MTFVLALAVLSAVTLLATLVNAFSHDPSPRPPRSHPVDPSTLPPSRLLG